MLMTCKTCGGPVAAGALECRACGQVTGTGKFNNLLFVLFALALIGAAVLMLHH